MLGEPGGHVLWVNGHLSACPESDPNSVLQWLSGKVSGCEAVGHFRALTSALPLSGASLPLVLPSDL